MKKDKTIEVPERAEEPEAIFTQPDSPLNKEAVEGKVYTASLHTLEGRNLSATRLLHLRCQHPCPTYSCSFLPTLFCGCRSTA